MLLHIVQFASGTYNGQVEMGVIGEQELGSNYRTDLIQIWL